MVSLGPISEKRHCSFRCPFCYVEGSSFIKYANWETKETISWLLENEKLYDVIYVSGDTDSFAPPRTEEGIHLLECVARLKKDVLFTTRHVFNTPEHFSALERIALEITQRGNLALACASVCQLTQPHLEPRPIKMSAERIEQLKQFKLLGWTPVLAMRPIMPGVPPSDFSEIIKLASRYTSYCLISPYFYEPGSLQQIPEGLSMPIGPLYFDMGESSNWRKVLPSANVLSSIRSAAHQYHVQIFEESSTLYNQLKQHLS